MVTVKDALVKLPAEEEDAKVDGNARKRLRGYLPNWMSPAEASLRKRKAYLQRLQSRRDRALPDAISV
jgi:hypothetical protein